MILSTLYSLSIFTTCFPKIHLNFISLSPSVSPLSCCSLRGYTIHILYLICHIYPSISWHLLAILNLQIKHNHISPSSPSLHFDIPNILKPQTVDSVEMPSYASLFTPQVVLLTVLKKVISICYSPVTRCDALVDPSWGLHS
jgi:hypothetical protein